MINYGAAELIAIHIAIFFKVSVKEAHFPLKPANVYKRKTFCCDVISFREMLFYERKSLGPEFKHCFDALVVRFVLPATNLIAVSKEEVLTAAHRIEATVKIARTLLRIVS